MHLARTSLAALLTAGLLAPSAAAQAAPFPFHDGFESGSLAPHWTVTKHWGDGSAQVTTANGPHTGAYHLNLQGPPAAIDSNVTVDLAIDLTGESGVRLGFLVRDYGDEYSTSTSSWLGAGSHYYDGVFASGDGGVTWHEVLPLNDLTATGVYQAHVVDLDAALAGTGVTYGPDFVLRFSWEDEYAIPTDGFAIDEVRLFRAGYTVSAVYQSSAPTTGGAFGSAVVELPDLDGDGVGDLAVGHPGYSSARGRVEILSGATGSQLHAFAHGSPGDRRGSTLALVDDLDGDGVPELLAGAPFADGGGTDAGTVFVYSLGSFSQLHFVQGKPGDRMGTALALGPDLTGDGRGELVVALPGHDGPSLADVGRVSFLDSTGFGTVLVADGQQAGEELGASLDLFGDFDGDGVDDLIVGSVEHDLIPFLDDDVGCVRVVSTGTGMELLLIPGDFSASGFGGTVAGLGDVDGDGVPDLAAGAPGAGFADGTVKVLSGATGLLLRELPGQAPADRYGANVRRIADFDGDGVADLLVANDRADQPRVDGVDPVLGGVLFSLDTLGSDAGLGSALVDLGDADGDGLRELLMGADGVKPTGTSDNGLVFAVEIEAQLLSLTPPVVHATTGGTVTLKTSGVPDGPATLQLGALAVPVVIAGNTAQATLPPLGYGVAEDLVVAASVSWAGAGTTALAAALTWDVPELVQVTPGVVPFDSPTAVTIELTDNLVASGFGTVTFDGATATTGTWFTAGGTTLVTAIAPVLAAPGDHPIELEITSGGMTEYVRVESGALLHLGPGVTDLSPKSGPQVGGTTVQLDLIGFHPGVPLDVKLGSTLATVIPTGVVQAATASFQTDTNQVTGPVDLHLTQDLGGGVVKSSITPAAFTFQRPTVGTPSPAGGPQAGGTTVTVPVTDFFSGPATVNLGSQSLVGTISGTPQVLTFVAPASPTPGPKTLRVRQAPLDVSVPDAYQYSAPSALSVAPVVASWFDPVALTITGQDFAPGVPVTVQLESEPPLAAVVVDAQTITVQVPAGHVTTAGLQDLTIDQAGVLAELSDTFASQPRQGSQLTGSASLGGAVTVQLDCGNPGVALVGLSGAQLPSPLPLGSFHHGLLLDPVGLSVVATPPLLAGTSVVFLPFPPGLFLPGQVIHLQSLVVEPVGATTWFSFTNAEELTLP